MTAVKKCNKEYEDFTKINDSELVSSWWALTDEQRDSYGCAETAFTHYLRMEFDRFQNGETKYK